MELNKGYKNTEVGVIPEDWEVKNLGELLVFGSGMDYKHLSIGDIPVYGTGGIMTLVNDYLYDGESVGIGRKGTIDKPIFLNGKFWTVDTLFYTHSFKFCIPKFIYYKFCLITWKNYNEASGVPSLNKNNLKQIKIPLPPLAEQTAIASVLSDTDRLLEALEKKIAKKRLIKKGAMQELLTGKKRLLKFNGAGGYKKTEIGVIPEDWEVKTLGEIGGTFGGLSGKTKKDFINGIYPYIPFMNIMSNPIVNTKYFDYMNLSKGESQNKCIKGDLFFNGSSETADEVGFCSVLLENIPNLYLNSFCFGFRLFNKEEENGLFLAYFFRSPFGRRLMSILAQGATRYNLSKRNFLNLKIPLPPLAEQTEIATILSDMDSEIESLEKQLAKYRKIKTAMMQELLTGKIRLSVASSVENKVVNIVSQEKKLPKKRHSWEFNEAVVIAVLSNKFGSEKYPLGRKRYTKLSYLLHRQCEGEAVGYQKKAAGPYNPNTKYKVEEIAIKKKYIKKSKREEYSGFVAAENISQAEKYFEKWYGQEALHWLEQFKYEKNDTLELWTTVDMAINDLEKENKTVSMQAVKNLIKSHKEWEQKLQRPIFSDENIQQAIEKVKGLFSS